MASDTQVISEAVAIKALAEYVAAVRTLLAAGLDAAVSSGLIERQRGMIGPSLLDALDALDLAGEFLSSTETDA